MKLAAHAVDDLGRTGYTNIGQAEADMTSADMALDAVLIEDLTPAQRRDVLAAQAAARKALRSLRRHMDFTLSSTRREG